MKIAFGKKLSVKKLRNKVHYIFHSIIIVTYSCSGYQYVPSPQYIPLNEKKGEARAILYSNSVQLGYSVTDHISVFSTGNFRKNGSSTNFGTAMSKENSGKYFTRDSSNEVNIGISYFRKQNNIVCELLLGSGIGNVTYTNIKDVSPDYKFRMKSKRFNIFLQPNIGYKIEEYLELCFFTKLTYYNYYNISTSTTLGGNPDTEPYDKYFINRTKANLFFYEPGMALKAGYKNMKFQVLFSFSGDLTNQEIKSRILNLRFGLSLYLDVLDVFRKKDKNF